MDDRTDAALNATAKSAVGARTDNGQRRRVVFPSLPVECVRSARTVAAQGGGTCRALLLALRACSAPGAPVAAGAGEKPKGVRRSTVRTAAAAGGEGRARHTAAVARDTVLARRQGGFSLTC